MSKPVEEWTTEDCVHFLLECASKHKLSSDKLAQYTHEFRKSEITGWNLSDEYDTEWTSIISTPGLRGLMKRMLRPKITGTLHVIPFFLSINS
jgi:hypothetical protein